jgi:hypothetical protein
MRIITDDRASVDNQEPDGAAYYKLAIRFLEVGG